MLSTLMWDYGQVHVALLLSRSKIVTQQWVANMIQFNFVEVDWLILQHQNGDIQFKILPNIILMFN